MITTASSLFRAPSTPRQQAAEKVVSALLALEPKVESLENPGVLAAGSGGGGWNRFTRACTTRKAKNQLGGLIAAV